MLLTVKSASTPGRLEAYGARYSEETMRHIDAFVRAVASRPLNEQELRGYKNTVMSDTRLILTKVYDIIEARHEAGLYADLLSSLPKPVGSIPGNLRKIGVRLP